jgi:hypothetical protein
MSQTRHNPGSTFRRTNSSITPVLPGYPSKFEFGEPASEQEIAAISIAIPVDGKGLPSGQGDYARGKQVYETACAACHGAAMAFAAICVDPTLSTRTSAAVARVDETISVSMLTAIVRKDRRMMSSSNDAVVIARESTTLFSKFE